MLRASLALLALLALAVATPALAAPSIYRATFRGDGFDGSVGISDGCRYVDVYFSGSDYATKSQPGAPQTSNALWGYVNVFDCDSQGWGSAYFDQANATMSANGVSGATVSATVSVAFGHWEPSEEQYCESYEGWCWIDDEGNEHCEPAGEYCYPAYWFWVEDGTQSLSFDLALAPTGDTYRGMQMSTQKTPWGMFRSRYTGTQRYATVTGSATLDGEAVLGTEWSWSWGNLWNTTSGYVERYDF